MKRTSLIAALLVAAGSLFAPPVVAQDAVGFRLNWYLSGWMAPFYYGAQEGYYKAEGIDVTLHEGRGSGVTIQLIGAKTDMFGFADTSTMMVAITKDVPVKSVASILNINDAGVISLAGKGIKSAKDLEGRKIATTPGDSTTATFPAYCRGNAAHAWAIAFRSRVATAAITIAAAFYPPVRVAVAANPGETLVILGLVNVALRFLTKGRVSLFA